MGRFFAGLLVTTIVVGVFSLPCLSEEGNVSQRRYASLTSEQENEAASSGAAAEVGLPMWLDELMTRLPDPGDTSDLERELSETLIEPLPDIRVEEEIPVEESGGVFPRPPIIKPLYSSPVLVGEGVWSSEGTPRDADGHPLVYKTAYRPSVEYPNAVVYMAVFDITRLRPRLFIGQTEPGIYEIANVPESEDLSKIVAITNAMWMQQHARGAGAIFRGREVYPMVSGMATLIIYQDNSVDIREWSSDIPRHLVRDARQLRHLIVKDGLVVEKVARRGKIKDAEIGLGGFLVDKSGRSTMRSKYWFLADRSAFGIREDGNLVFAMAHHCSTKDLAKALVLAGCKRAIHGDANIHNIVCNFYFRNDEDRIVQREKLSPEQKKYTMRRYDRGYSKDFFAFYERRSVHMASQKSRNR
jgi:Phosphodiester glycosidase